MSGGGEAYTIVTREHVLAAQLRKHETKKLGQGHTSCRTIKICISVQKEVLSCYASKSLVMLSPLMIPQLYSILAKVLQYSQNFITSCELFGGRYVLEVDPYRRLRPRD